MNKKILIIEDTFEVRDNLAEILMLSGYTVETAENGKIGVQKAITMLPDLIICDVMMPELDGFGVLRILSKNLKTNLIPFIFLTAKAEKIDFRKGMNLGADDYITKPFDDVELLDAIEMRLQKSAQIKQHSEQYRADFLDEDVAQKELDILIQKGQLSTFRKKDLLYEEETYPRYLYYLNRGKVKLTIISDEGKEFILDILKEGSFIGYQALFQNSNYTESASTLEDCSVTRIPRDAFFEFIRTNRMVAHWFMKQLAKDFAQKEIQAVQLAYSPVRKRVAEALLMLNERYSKVHQPTTTFSILREELANIVGTAKETLIRTLTDFKSEGIIEIHSSKITVLKPIQLERI